MAVVTVRTHHPHDGCSPGTTGHSKGNPHDPDSRVSKKISILMHEGTPQKQAVATALSMKRAGRLTKEGGYIRAK